MDNQAGTFEDQLDRLLKGGSPTATGDEPPTSAPQVTEESDSADTTDAVDTVDPPEYLNDIETTDPGEDSTESSESSEISEISEIPEESQALSEAAADSDGSLETQLDSLLSGLGAEAPTDSIEPAVEAAAQANELDEPAEADESADVQAEAEAGDAQAPAEEVDAGELAGVGDQLGTQLDELLAAAGEPPPAMPAADVSVAESESESIHDLDAMLSQNADEAVADEFETPAQAAAVEAEQRESPAPLSDGDDAFELDANTVKNSEAGAAKGDESAGEFSTTEDQGEAISEPASAASAPAVAPASAPKPAKAKGGPVSAASLIGGFQAGAAAVAQELDEDAAGFVADDMPEGNSELAAPAKRRMPGWFGRVAGALSDVPRVLAIINAPLRRCSPQTRATIGYIGLITLFNGLVLVILALTKLSH